MVNGAIKTVKKTYKNLIKGIQDYTPIFELAKAALYLPFYVNAKDELLVEEEHDTGLKNLIKTSHDRRNFKNVKHKYKLRTRTVWNLILEEELSLTGIVLKDDKFQIEKGGYWKPLDSDEIGSDKKGKPIVGKTWVTRHDSYFQSKAEELIVSKKAEKLFEGVNAGYIYIVRNPSFEKDIYKIGLTTTSTEKRISQLSNTSVPDGFALMRKWNVRDCKKAEKQIHKILNKYRINPKREFFKVDMDVANKVVEDVVKRINLENDLKL